MGTYIIILAVALLLNFAAFIWLVITGFKRSVLWGVLIFLLSPFTAIIFAVTNWFDAKRPFIAYILTSILIFVPVFMIAGQYDAQFMQRLGEKMESGEIKENEMVKYLMDPGLLDELEKKQSDVDGTVILDEDGNTVVVKPEDTSVTGDETATIKPGTENGQQGKTGTTKDAKADASRAGDTAKQKETKEEEVVEEEWSEHPKPGQAKPDPLQIKKKQPPPESVRVSLSKVANFKGRYFIVTTKSGSQHRGILIKTTKYRIVLERKIYGGTFTYKILKSKIKRLEMLKKDYVEEMS